MLFIKKRFLKKSLLGRGKTGDDIYIERNRCRSYVLILMIHSLKRATMADKEVLS